MKNHPKPKLTFEQFRAGIKKHAAYLRASRKAQRERELDEDLDKAVDNLLAEEDDVR